MDIYKYAEEYGYAVDYYDQHTGRIYKITEAKDHDGKIPVIEDGEFIGYVERR